MISSWKTVASRVRAILTYETPKDYWLQGGWRLMELLDPAVVTFLAVDRSS